MQFKSRELSAEQLSAIQMLVYTDMLKADIVAPLRIYQWCFFMSLNVLLVWCYY